MRINIALLAGLVGSVAQHAHAEPSIVDAMQVLVEYAFKAQDQGVNQAFAQLEREGARAISSQSFVEQRLALGSDRLIDEHHAQVESELLARQGTGKAQLTLSSDTIAQLPASQLTALLEALQLSRQAVAKLVVSQQMDVMWGWMRLNAGIALGPRAPGEPQMPGANGHDESLSTKEYALSTVAGLDGFIDIFISCPETVDGLNGCKVERIAVNGPPAVAVALKQSGSSSFLELPVHRKIFISSHNSGGRRWAAGPSFVLTPDGDTEILPCAIALAAVGAGRKVGERDITPWLPLDDRSTPRDGRRAALQREDWLSKAQAGAALVKDLLARTQPKDVMK